ncbi:thioesterase family protein [soil metagenome]
MSTLLELLDVQRGDTDVWVAAGHGPADKRAFGGQFVAQSMAAAGQTVPAETGPTSMHLQFLRGGAAADPVDYAVERTYDGRTAMTRRVVARQGERIITTATVSFAVPLAGPAHGHYGKLPGDPETLAATGPAGPAPGLPLDELDIRIVDEGAGPDFVRRLWWRATVSLPSQESAPLIHTCVALFVTDVYMIDPALQVHGHSMRDRSHRSGTTDSSVWFHAPIRADRWNLLESRSPAAARGRGVVTASLVGADGTISATLVQEGLIALRE